MIKAELKFKYNISKCNDVDNGCGLQTESDIQILWALYCFSAIKGIVAPANPFSIKSRKKKKDKMLSSQDQEQHLWYFLSAGLLGPFSSYIIFYFRDFGPRSIYRCSSYL